MSNKYYQVTVSPYAAEQHRVDMETLAKVVEAVHGGFIVEKTVEYGIGEWEKVNGAFYRYYDENGDEYTEEEIEENGLDINEMDMEETTIHSYYIVSESGAQILINETDELVFYNAELNLYVWGITFCGMDWSGVLTSITL